MHIICPRITTYFKLSRTLKQDQGISSQSISKYNLQLNLEFVSLRDPNEKKNLRQLFMVLSQI